MPIYDVLPDNPSVPIGINSSGYIVTSNSPQAASTTTTNVGDIFTNTDGSIYVNTTQYTNAYTGLGVGGTVGTVGEQGWTTTTIPVTQTLTNINTSPYNYTYTTGYQWQQYMPYPQIITLDGINYVPRIQADGSLKWVPENGPVQAEAIPEEKIPFVYVDRDEMNLEIERYE